jgi:hypothetical protein
MQLTVGVYLRCIVWQVSDFPDEFGRNIMGETIQSVFRRLLRQNIGSILIPLLAFVGIIWVISIIGIVPLVWSAIAAAFVPVVLTVIQFMQWFPFESTKADQEMDRLIQLYKGIRYYTYFSTEKTRNMQNVIISMRGQAEQAKYTPQETRSFLLSQDEGKRLAGLCIVQWQWSDEEIKKRTVQYFNNLLNTKGSATKYFEDVAVILEKPRSPFEHYQAKVAMDKMLPYLPQQSPLKQVLCNHVNKHVWDMHISCEKKEWEPFKANVNKLVCGTNGQSA